MNLRLVLKLLPILILFLRTPLVEAQSNVDIAKIQNITYVQMNVANYKSNATAIDENEIDALDRLQEALLDLENHLQGKNNNENINDIADRYCEAAIRVESFGQPFQSVERVMILGSEYYWLGASIGKNMASKYNYEGKCLPMGAWHDK
jgi:hypothetical protein